MEYGVTFEKYSNIKLEAELFFVDGQTDRHDEANSHFCKNAKVPNL